MHGLRQRLPLYVGGFMGPFGTIIIIPMFPELRTEFDASSSQVSLAFSLYLIPFAALLLVSGTLGERWGRRRTVRGTYLVYALFSLVAAIAPNLEVFIAARAVQGIANAFITPLLVAGLAELVPPDRFGRELGIYSSFQALGSGLGPVLGGLAADTSWPIAFIGTGVVAFVLALAPPQGEPRDDVASLQLRTLFNRRLIALGLSFLFAAAGPIGAGVIVGVAARDAFGLSGTETGLVLLFGSLTALALGPLWGSVLDRYGPRRVGLAAVVGVSVLTVVTGLTSTAVPLGVLWAVTSALAALTVIVFQALGATLLPDNRGGALSFLLSFRFLGHALGPLALVPMISWSVSGTFAITGALGALTLVLLVAGLSAQLHGRTAS